MLSLEIHLGHQLSMVAGTGSWRFPFYHKVFHRTSKTNFNLTYLSALYHSCTMVCRWYEVLMSLGQKMLKDNRYKEIPRLPQCIRLFSRCRNNGGVCYVLWDKIARANAKYIHIKVMKYPLPPKSVHSVVKRAETLSDAMDATSILRKVQTISRGTKLQVDIIQCQ